MEELIAKRYVKALLEVIPENQREPPQLHTEYSIKSIW